MLLLLKMVNSDIVLTGHRCSFRCIDVNCPLSSASIVYISLSLLFISLKKKTFIELDSLPEPGFLLLCTLTSDALVAGCCIVSLYLLLCLFTLCPADVVCDCGRVVVCSFYCLCFDVFVYVCASKEPLMHLQGFIF